MVVAVLVVTAILVSVSYLALRILSEVVVTPPTPLRELADQPQEMLRLPGEGVVQLQISPNGQYLAVITFREDTGESSLRVYALEPLKIAGGMNTASALLYERAVKGYRMGWLNFTISFGEPSLVYEDAGDIFRLDFSSSLGPDLRGLEPVNLTAGSPDLESDPLPSPDGRFILFRRAQMEEGGRLAYWYMRPDGSEPRKMGPLPATPSWSPDATRLATYQEATRSETARPNEYFLELVELPSGAGDPFAASNGETRYVNWLDDSTLVYVAMYITPDLTEVKGVVYSIGAEAGADEKGLATLKSLNDPDQPYAFYLSRDRGRLAYQGNKGLEFFDIEEEKVYRETQVPSFSALDWVPAVSGNPGIIFAREDIIYSIDVDTGNEAP
jgi:hypothetical protein